MIFNWLPFSKVFPPGHYYTATAGGADKGVARPFYKEKWCKEIGFMPGGTAADLRQGRYN